MIRNILFLLFISPSLFAQVASDSTNADQKIYTLVEEKAEFPGGQEALSKFLARKLRYPAEAVKKRIQGNVYVTFVVEIDGSISNAKVVKGVQKDIDEEAMRVVKMMPKWKPGKQKGEAVRTLFTLPILFRLS